MGQVTFKLEADEAKAVKAFMRVVEAQNKVGSSPRWLPGLSGLAG